MGISARWEKETCLNGIEVKNTEAIQKKMECLSVFLIQNIKGRSCDRKGPLEFNKNVGMMNIINLEDVQIKYKISQLSRANFKISRKNRAKMEKEQEANVDKVNFYSY